MYSPLQIGLRYLKHYATSYHSRGHGIHSPLVFDFITHVLQDRKPYPCYEVLEAARTQLRKEDTWMDVQDFGAGSGTLQHSRRRVSDIARTSLKSRPFAQLLFRIVNYYRPKTMLELGTSLGISTAYMAMGNPAAGMVTLEGDPGIAHKAAELFQRHALHNIEQLVGPFSATLPEVLKNTGNLDFVFVDGHHAFEPTLNYFHQLLSHKGPGSIFVFDDIHWSPGMEAAWKEIQQHPEVTLSLDLFFIGMVFFTPDMKVKQHFNIRY